MLKLCHKLFTIFIQHITLICKKYSKFIAKLVEFINDLSITCSICSAQVFDWYVSYPAKENLSYPL